MGKVTGILTLYFEEEFCMEILKRTFRAKAKDAIICNLVWFVAIDLKEAVLNPKADTTTNIDI